MGERGPQVNRKGAVLYSEGLLRKSRLFIKEMEVGVSLGQGGDRRGVCAAVVTFIGVGRAVRLVEATSLSSPKRPCKEAACMRRPREHRRVGRPQVSVRGREGRGHRRWEVSGGGEGGRVAAPQNV